MKTSTRNLFLLCVLLAGLCTGCGRAGLYARNRLFDAMDVFQLNGGYSKSFSFELKATDLVTVFCAIGDEWKVGCMGRDFGRWMEHKHGVAIAGFREVYDWEGEAEYDTEIEIPGMITKLQETYNYFPNLVNLEADRNVHWIDQLNFELGLSIAVVNLRVGFGVGHFIDFVAGIFGSDPGEDDGLFFDP